MNEAKSEHVDVLIVGAGISGIAAAYYLKTRCPQLTYAIVEAREAIGGTWDLFRYPGVRSDSDMFTLGYSFRPWAKSQAIADGESILQYVVDTAREFGIDRAIRFKHRVERADWSSSNASWSVATRRTDSGESVHFTCRFLFACTGYYNYAQGYSPAFREQERFRGLIVHPQHWPRDLDVTGKRVVVIGSGATAITLVPALAAKAAKVTMLQRSPSYVLSLPGTDNIGAWLRRRLPLRTASALTRWKNVTMSSALYGYCRAFPNHSRAMIVDLVRKKLGADFDIEKHFSPNYAPWDQRICLAPDGDLFDAIKSGRANVVTDHIESFTEAGIALQSGGHLFADIIVTATGLQLQVFGGAKLSVDGQQVESGKTLNYKGAMLRDVPNFAVLLGYTNASWTLKCELVAKYLCRLLNHMDRTGSRVVVPRLDDPNMPEVPLVKFFLRLHHESAR